MNKLTDGCRDRRLEPKQVMGSILAWTFKYHVPPIFCLGRQFAAAAVRMLLYHAAGYATGAPACPARLTLFEKALAGELRPLRSALCSIADILIAGRESHPDDDGFKQPVEFHIERAKRHLEALAAGDKTEGHLEHAATRLLMALEVRER